MLRAAIFIDGGYILNQFKMNRINPDFEKLPDYLLAPLRKSIQLDMLRCYFYYCAPWMSAEPSEDELRRMASHEEFEQEITSFDRWQLRLGKLERRREGNKEYFEQKRVDVLLSVDLVRHAAAGHIQHAILVAGDSDFIPAVAAAKESGVTMTVWCGAFNSVHRDLIILADEVHQFDWSKVPKSAGDKTPHRGTRPPLSPSERQRSSSSRRGPHRPVPVDSQPESSSGGGSRPSFSERIKSRLKGGS